MRIFAKPASRIDVPGVNMWWIGKKVDVDRIARNLRSKFANTVD